MVMTLGKAGKLCRVLGHCTRQRFFLKQKIFAECQAGEALGKELFKKNKKCLCQVPCRRGTRQRVFEKKMSLPSALTVGTRQRPRQWSSAVDGCFSLPSVVVGPRKRLCRMSDKWPSTKSLFAVKFFSDSSLPRAALGKAFTEGFWVFAESSEPSAKASSSGPEQAAFGFIERIATHVYSCCSVLPCLLLHGEGH